jgi:hypothetical protein
MALLALTLACVGEPLPAAADRAVGVVALGDVPTGLVARTVSWIGGNLVAAADLGRVGMPATNTASVMSALQALAMNRPAVVALVADGQTGPLSNDVHAAGRVATVDVDALRVDGQAPRDAERFAIRVEKEALRGAALALGLPPCVFPRCAAYPSADARELDDKGRNLCPPCHVKMCEELLPVQGLKGRP